MLDAVVVGTLLIVVGNAIASTAPSGEPLPPETVFAEWVVLVGIWVGYWAILVGRFGATVGQRVARVRVVAGGVPIGVSRQLVRCAIAPLAFAPLGLGYILAILDWSYRSVVDIASRTRVVAVAQVGAGPAPSEDYAESSWPSSVAIDRVSTVADALAASGHWWAVGAVRQAVGDLTADPGAWAGAAWAFARAGDPFRVFAITKRLLGDDEQSPPLALPAHALALALTDAPEEATETLQRARRVPDAVRLFVEVEIALAADDLDAAHTRIVALTREDPESLDTWLLAARVARRRNDADAARHCAEQSLRVAPTNADARDAQAAALAPQPGVLHRPASTEELSALVAVLDVDPFHDHAQQRLSEATLWQRRVNFAIAFVLGLLGVARIAVIVGGNHAAVNLILAPVFLIASTALFMRYFVVRARLTDRIRPWVRYLEALTRAMIRQRGGRSPAAPVGISPAESVLGSPGRCWCATLQHTRGTSALAYVHSHLLEAEPSPLSGVFVFRCPADRGAYIGIDGSFPDGEVPFTELYRVEPRDLAAPDSDVPIGMYL